MKPHRTLAVILVILIALGLISAARFGWWSSDPQIPPEAALVGRPAKITPDYSGCRIPPNIAPTNFRIDEPANKYRVHIHSDADDGFVIACSTSKVTIPSKPWTILLDRNRGKQIRIDVYAQRSSSVWQRFDSISNWVTEEEIDPFVGYRSLGPIQVLSCNMGTYQRELSSYSETPILESKEGSSMRCVNCHTYANNNPDQMLLHIRGADGTAMLLATNGTVRKIDTRNEFCPYPGSYSAWHPSGRFIALSYSSMVQFFHTAGNRRDVFMYDSDIGIYSVDANRVDYPEGVAITDRIETFPAWSPDGRYLYFSATSKQWDSNGVDLGPVPPVYRDVRYDLMRIPFDPDTGTWGPLETVLSSEEVGLTILEPKVSPDGKYVLVTMAEYGSFPVFLDSSDLYLIDLESGEYRALTINSPYSDSWHSWSTNGRWFVFASKRDDGVFGRLFFSYFDQDGTEHKPFLLPQADPGFYDTNLNNFNAPEFAIKAVSTRQLELLRAIYDTDTLSVESEYGNLKARGSGKPDTSPKSMGSNIRMH